MNEVIVLRGCGFSEGGHYETLLPSRIESSIHDEGDLGGCLSWQKIKAVCNHPGSGLTTLGIIQVVFADFGPKTWLRLSQIIPD